MAETETLLVHTDGPITVLTLNRPRVRNAVDDDLREQFLAALDEVARNETTRVAIVTGAGTAFCAGGDIRGMQARLDSPAGTVAVSGWRRQLRTFALSSTLHELPQVTIAAVNGAAAGLGMDLALACDFVVAGPAASFTASFVHRGLVSDGGGLYHLPRRVGLQRAKELFFSGRSVDAAEGSQIGLVDELAEGDDVLAAARAYAERFASQPAASLMLTKAIVNEAFEHGLPEVGALGRQAQAMCYTTDEHRASVEAFLASRGSRAGR